MWVHVPTNTRMLFAYGAFVISFASTLSIFFPVLMVAFHIDAITRQGTSGSVEAWAESSELIWDIISLRRAVGGDTPGPAATTEGENRATPLAGK